MANARVRFGACVLLGENDLLGDAGVVSTSGFGPADADEGGLTQGGFPFPALGNGVDVVVQSAKVGAGTGQLLMQPGRDLPTKARMFGREITARAGVLDGCGYGQGQAIKGFCHLDLAGKTRAGTDLDHVPDGPDHLALVVFGLGQFG